MVFACATPVAAQGIGNLTVTPTRVVFEGRTRSAVIALVNNGLEAASYRISVINMRMTENGGFEQLEDSTPALAEEHFATELFRYAPRQIELAPGESQSIRLQLRKPANLVDGEYRSHLLIQSIPKEGAGRSVEAPTSQQGVSVNLVVVPGVSLPVIIRQGNLSANVSLADMHVIAPSSSGMPAQIGFRIVRTGTRSVFGDLTALYYEPGSRNGLVVSQVNQLSVYTPNPSRSVAMPITLPEGVKLATGGRFEVTYATPEKEGGVVMTKGEFTVP